MSHSWQTGFFSCFSDIGTCCLTTWCPCVTYSRTGYRLEHRHDPQATEHSFCTGSCWLYCALSTCTGGIGSCVLQLIRRGEVRQQLNIQGNGFTDVLAPFCCPCCQLIQEDREVKEWQEGKGPYAAMQPVAQNPMVYQQQPM